MYQQQIGGKVSIGLMLITTALALGCTAETLEDDAEQVGESQQALVKTAYDTSWGWRNIYALTYPVGTYVAQITWKNGWNNNCGGTQAVMGLLPASDTTWSVCASLGAEYKVVNGSGNACTSTTTHQPVAVYKYSWFATDTSEVNYRVVDRGYSTYDYSGWMPSTPGNGCPRPGLY